MQQGAAQLPDCSLSCPPLQNSTDPLVPVFKYTACVPCTTGNKCPTGSSVACAAGSYTELVGAAACFTCPNGTASQAGESGPQPCHTTAAWMRGGLLLHKGFALTSPSLHTLTPTCRRRDVPGVRARH